MIYRYLRLCNYTRGIFKKKYYLNVSIDLINRTEDRRERGEKIERLNDEQSME